MLKIGGTSMQKINCIYFEDEDDLQKLTELNHEQLWDNGFNLDDWDCGFCCFEKLENDSWLMRKLQNEDYRYTVYNNRHYYMIYH